MPTQGGHGSLFKGLEEWFKDGAVPHPTTLMKLTTRCGGTAVNG
jgi:hypothetical protein